MTASKPAPLFDQPEPQSSSLVVAAPVVPEASPGPLAMKAMEHQLRHSMSSQPVETQGMMLQELSARRDNFRDWLFSQLIEGIHYGYPPGCEPKWVFNQAGEKIGTKDWKGNVIPITTWRPKESLYAAGADFIVEICGLIDSYEPSEVAWKQMGGITGMAVVICRLHAKADGKLVGESLGAHLDKKDAEKAANKALKMAMKSAKVGAVINAYGLRDLFTQDDAPKPPRGENPEGDRSAPKADTRAARGSVTKERIGEIGREWKGQFATDDAAADAAEFKAWVQRVAKREFDPGRQANWNETDAKACYRELDIPWELPEGI